MKTYEQRLQSVLQKAEHRKSVRRAFTVAMSIGAAVAVLALVLFWPIGTQLPSVRQYRDSAYYPLIEKLNEYTYDAPQYSNNFQKLLGSLRSEMKGNGMAAAPEDAFPAVPGQNTYSPDVDDGTGTYEEVTDNQVAGVIESDLFKRSDKYIFRLYGAVLYVYSIAQADSQLVGSYTLSSVDDWMSYGNLGLYLSQDCSTVTVIGQGYEYWGDKGNTSAVLLVNLDVSDPANIKETGKTLMRGFYSQSRMVDGDFLVTYRVENYRNNVDFANETSFVPQYICNDEKKSIAMEDIVLPEVVESCCYTVICKIDGKTLELTDTKALLSYSNDIYVSQDRLYVTNDYAVKTQEEFNGQYILRDMTEITGIDYSGDGLRILGSVTLEGHVKNQYSMDEYEGVFRVVTTTQDEKRNIYEEGAFRDDSWYTNCSLYCISLDSWQVIGKAEQFAPDNEEVTSVRFDGPNAYVCTAVKIILSDPVFFFDLSDPANITWTDTGTIDGYSDNLVQFGNGNLMGIGFNEQRQLKIEIYRQADGKVESVCAYERNCLFTQEYKAYYIDRENQMIGMTVLEPSDTGEDYIFCYLLLQFDGEKLNLIGEFKSEDVRNSLQFNRADIIDGWLYLLTHELLVFPLEK